MTTFLLHRATLFFVHICYTLLKDAVISLLILFLFCQNCRFNDYRSWHEHTSPVSSQLSEFQLHHFSCFFIVWSISICIIYTLINLSVYSTVRPLLQHNYN